MSAASTRLNRGALLFVLWVTVGPVTRANGAQGTAIGLAGGQLQMQVDKAWKAVQPRVRIIEHEFSVPAHKDDDHPGRVTIMHAGGTVEENMDRWIGQFTAPDGETLKDRTKKETKKVAGLEVHLIDISGTYHDRPGGPVAPAVERPSYRLLGAMIVSAKTGNYFVKFTGPQRTVAAHEKAFASMIDSLQWK
jgi:hypothetical protein